MRKTATVLVSIGLGALAIHCGGGDDSTSPTGNDAGGANDGAVLTDSGGGGDADVPRITVSGKLLNDSTPRGAPLTGREVVLLGADGTATRVGTGPGGAFTAPNIAVPYDVAVIRPETDGGFAGGQSTSYYEGITRPDPLVFGADYGSNVVNVGSYKVNMSACATCKIHVAAGNYVLDEYDGSGAAQDYQGTAQWNGSDAVTTDFYFLVEDTSTSAFTKWGMATGVQLVANTVKTISTPTLTALAANKTVTLTPTAANGYTASSRVSVLAAGNTLAQASATGPLTTHVPTDGPFGVELSLIAFSTPPTGGYWIADYGTLADVPSTFEGTPDVESTLLTPLVNQTGVDVHVRLSWSAVARPAVYQLGFNITPSYDQSFIVYTTKQSFDASKLDAVGAPLRAATEYVWEVSSNDVQATMDAWVVAAPAGEGVTARQTNSNSQTFTTQ